MGHEAALDALGSLSERVRTVMLARDRQLPVLPALEPLLPGGALRRGSLVAVAAGSASASSVPASSAPGASAPGGGSGATSLALALAAGASQAGSWVAAVGLGSLGLVAADQLGLALDRLVLVDDPPAGSGRSSVGWASVVAALVDGFDVVLVAAGAGVRRRAGDVRRLAARVRERGAVLVAVGGELPGQPGNVRLTVATSAWQGLGERERGYLHCRRLGVVATGRGEASRPRRAELWLPDARGRVTPAEPAPIPLRDRHPTRRVEPVAVGSGGPAGDGPLRDRRPAHRVEPVAVALRDRHSARRVEPVVVGSGGPAGDDPLRGGRPARGVEPVVVGSGGPAGEGPLRGGRSARGVEPVAVGSAADGDGMRPQTGRRIGARRAGAARLDRARRPGGEPPAAAGDAGDAGEEVVGVAG